MVDGHERHLIVVLRDGQLEIFERQILPAELAADHRQPDRRAPAAGDQLVAKPFGLVVPALAAVPDGQQRDEERRAMDQLDALLLHLDRLVQPALSDQRAAQIPVAAVEVGIDGEELPHLVLGLVEAAGADQHLAHDERHHHPERIVVPRLRGVVDGLVEAAEAAEQQRVVAVGRRVARCDLERPLEIAFGGPQVDGEERLGPAQGGVPFGQRSDRA